MRVLNKARIEELAKSFKWVLFAGESLDEWAAKQLEGYTPTSTPRAAMDVFGMEQKVFAVLDRATSRRLDALQLQGQAYMRALQYELARNSIKPTRLLLEASNLELQSEAIKLGMQKTSNLFTNSHDALGAGFSEQSKTKSEVGKINQINEAVKLKQQLDLQGFREKFEDDLQALHDWVHGPFDYENRYKKIKALYLNDLKNLVDVVANFSKGHTVYGLPFPNLSPPTDPDYLWSTTLTLQTVSRILNEYRSRRVSRNIVIRIGPTNEVFTGNAPWDCLVSQPNTYFPDWYKLLQENEKFVEFQFRIFAEKLAQIAPELNDVRLIALAPQWITPYPAKGTDDATLYRQNASLAYERRLRVPTYIQPPTYTTNTINDKIYLPLASTTDDEIEQIVAVTGEEIFGRPIVGDWTIGVGKPIRRGGEWGSFLPRTRGVNESALYPSIQGLMLHLKVSGIPS